MKSLKFVLLGLAFPLFFNQCSKEKLCGEYDLNEDGKPDKIFESFTNKKYSLYYFGENDMDTNYIAVFSKRPFSWSFYDVNGDGYHDAVYSEISGDKTKTFILNNEAGIFSKEAEEMK